jgi:hypothetical protein
MILWKCAPRDARRY